MKTFIAMVATLILSLTSCATLSHETTQSEATFLAVKQHQLIVQLDMGGAFSNQRSLPLGDDVKVTVHGKNASLDKLREGERIRISRDTITHEVVAIEGL